MVFFLYYFAQVFPYRSDLWAFYGFAFYGYFTDPLCQFCLCLRGFYGVSSQLFMTTLLTLYANFIYVCEALWRQLAISLWLLYADVI